MPRSRMDRRRAAQRSTRRRQPHVYLRPIDSLESRVISGTEGATNPFFSPDGQWLGFFAGGKLKKLLANGGAALTLELPRASNAMGEQRSIELRAEHA